MAAAPTTLMSLTCAPFLLQGLCSPPRSFHLTNKKQRPRKAGFTMVKALLELKPPPYPLDALEPHMSKETLEYHWGKHHSGYVNNLNKQIAESELDGMSLEDIIITSYNKGDLLPAFNNAAQVWNHDFFWESMKPGGGGKPSGELLEMIERDFGSFEEFVEKFKLTAATQFGSGWAWLAYKANRLEVENAENPRPSEEDKKLVVVKSPNAVNPLVWDYYPLLAIDVWEHAYYLDFENRRVDYASIFLEKLVSWETVSSRLESAKAQHVAREIARELAIENAARAQAEGQQAEQLENVACDQADDLQAEQSEKGEQVTERRSSDSDDSEDGSEDDSEDDSEDGSGDTEDDSEN